MRNLIKSTRLSKGIKSRELAQLIGVDQAIVSKIENGSRFPTKDQLLKIADILEIPKEEILPLWLKEKILLELKYEPYANQALSLVQEELSGYNRNNRSILSESLQEKLDRIDVLKSQLDKLRQFDSYRIAQALELEYTFESNRIEGNTLTLRETDLVLNEGLTISGKSMREHLEVLNHQEAIYYIKEFVQKKLVINERELLVIHNLILRGIMPEHAGKYRDIQVMIKGSTHMPPQPFLVPKQMEELFIWFNSNKLILHPIILAAEFHERLVTIHPFVDGNGRTSRLLMNLILLSNGYVIANIKGDYETRMNYYNSLEEAQTTDSKNSFFQFIADVEIDCLERYLKILGG
jgi:Fic family protein/DNA-binding XRE family transcriptional regulator